MRPNQSRAWGFPLLLAVFFVAVGSAPYLYGYAIADEDEVFAGFVGRGTPGANSYFAFARQAAEGPALVTNLYAPESPSRAYFNPEWWVMGQAARWSGWTLETWFHIGRAISAAAFLLAAYHLCAVFLARERDRQAALLLIAFGAGFGWIVVAANALTGAGLPPTNDAQGVTVFGYLMNKPHFMRAGAFAALQYAWLIRGDQTGRRRYFALSGLAAAGHSVIRPYHIPESCLVLALYVAARSLRDPALFRPVSIRAAIALAAHAPAIAWQAWIFLRNPLGLGAMDAWSAPGVFELIGWFGLPLAAILIHLGFVVVRGEGWKPSLSAPVIWLAAAALLGQAAPWFPWGVESYFAWVLAPPLLFMRHTAPALIGWTGAGPSRRLLTACLIALAALPTNLLVYADFFRGLHAPTPPWRYFVSSEVLSALDWLSENAPEEAVVLASHDTSQFIPRYANFKVVTGQDALTPNYREANAHMARFFQSGDDDGFKRWLRARHGVAYVLHGPWERALGDFDPAAHAWLQPLHTTGDVTVYRVQP
ncbi:MAG: hypothetical protein KF886_19225 [Candidatus Hydrogenedentes bacterium]|nr:hypothetical protein [Candidatus Hydrogenedentota bacterium]